MALFRVSLDKNLATKTERENKMSYDFIPNYDHVTFPTQYKVDPPRKKRPKQIYAHVTAWLTHLENLMFAGDKKAELTLKAFYDRKYLNRYK